MSPRALQSSEYDFVDDFAREEFYSGERICAPLKIRSRRGSMLRTAVMFAILGGGGWAALTYRETLEAWLVPAMTVVTSALERSAQPVPQQQQPAPLAAPAELPQAPREVADAPGAEAGTIVQSEPTPEAAVNDAAASEEKPAPLPPPQANPADPYQKRALAAGLHPDLSRAVLTRLTEKDFSNAAAAIKTALKETPEKGTYTYPKKSGTKGAAFEVRFVTAAAAQCRRYVVVVTLDRWSTTAPAMEKCGTELPGRGLKAASASGILDEEISKPRNER